MSAFDVYLTFDGTCAEAMRFYERVFGGKLDLMTFANSPMANDAPKGSENRIMHARLLLDGRSLMASDSMPGQPTHGMHGFSVSMGYPTVAAAEKIWKALGEGGTVNMPLQKTFWAEAFGMLTDRFGTPWMINCENTG